MPWVKSSEALSPSDVGYQRRKAVRLLGQGCYFTRRTQRLHAHQYIHDTGQTYSCEQVPVGHTVMVRAVPAVHVPLQGQTACPSDTIDGSGVEKEKIV